MEFYLFIHILLKVEIFSYLFLNQLLLCTVFNYCTENSYRRFKEHNLTSSTHLASQTSKDLVIGEKFGTSNFDEVSAANCGLYEIVRIVNVDRGFSIANF